MILETLFPSKRVKMTNLIITTTTSASTTTKFSKQMRSKMKNTTMKMNSNSRHICMAMADLKKKFVKEKENSLLRKIIDKSSSDKK